MELGSGGLPGSWWELAVLLVPPGHGRGAAEGTELGAKGTKRPGSLVLLHHPDPPSLVRRRRGGPGMDLARREAPTRLL